MWRISHTHSSLFNTFKFTKTIFKNAVPIIYPQGAISWFLVLKCLFSLRLTTFLCIIFSDSVPGGSLERRLVNLLIPEEGNLVSVGLGQQRCNETRTNKCDAYAETWVDSLRGNFGLLGLFAMSQLASHKTGSAGFSSQLCWEEKNTFSTLLFENLRFRS